MTESPTEIAKLSRIIFELEDKSIGVCAPTGALSLETTALRDLPPGRPFWILTFNTVEELMSAFPDYAYFYAYEADREVLGEPHGVSLGFDEWAKLQPPGTPGL